MSQKGEQTQRFQRDFPGSHDHHMQAHARVRDRSARIIPTSHADCLAASEKLRLVQRNIPAYDIVETPLGDLRGILVRDSRFAQPY